MGFFFVFLDLFQDDIRLVCVLKAEYISHCTIDHNLFGEGGKTDLTLKILLPLQFQNGKLVVLLLAHYHANPPA
jgi:transketolase